MNIKSLSLDFEQVGECILDNGLKSGVRFRLDRMKKDRVVYAFSADGEIKYIGVCESSDTTLDKRMGRYQGLVGSGTNMEIAYSIRDCLEEERKVLILAWKPDFEVEVAGMKIDLVKGMENPLIGELKTKWNKHK
jgi:hypothetical protein